jgi:photosystem II stability/assembly factor-like uncharacterized protein
MTKKLNVLFVVLFIIIFKNGFSQSGWSEITIPGVTSWGVDMHFLNSKTGFIVTYNSEFLKTTDGGLSWAISNAPDISNTSSVFFNNSSTGFLSQGSMIYKTTNGGTNWVRKHNPKFYAQLKKIRFLNAQTGYACGDYKTIVRTTDAGENWNIVLQSLTQPIEDLYNLFILDSQNIYVCGFSFFDHPVFLKTSNGGNTWSGTAPGGSDAAFFQTIFFNTNTGYLAGGSNSGGLYKTSNGGNSWININTNPLVLYFSSCFFTNANTGYLGSGAGTIYKTTNGGINLAAQYSLSQTDEIKQIYFTGNDTGYAITRQNLLKTINGGEPVRINLISTNIPEKFSLSQNYPNPFNPSTNIKFQIPEKSFTSIIVYDMLGKEVITLLNEELNAGYYNYQFNAENLNSGIYFYRIRTENFSETKKMVLVK